MSEQVVLVNAQDEAIGTSGKMDVHEAGSLHRAFSVFIFDSADRVLLQRRAHSKYHSGGLWSNSCCSHPRPGEATLAAAQRRLREELGVNCPLEPAFHFIYCADVGGGLIEHEFDHVYTGTFDGTPMPDPDEVEDWRWVSAAELRRELDTEPQRFTPWALIAFDELDRRGYLQPTTPPAARSRIRFHGHAQLQPGNG
jgi:isopentenyl-diphosphate Delta-isomerase